MIGAFRSCRATWRGGGHKSYNLMHFPPPGGIDFAKGMAKAAAWMHWVRSNIRPGSWCALLALAVQLVLSFGHVHRSEFPSVSASSPLSAVSTGAASTTGSDASSAAAKPIGLGSDYCAICAAMVLANSVRMAAAPALPRPAVGTRVRFTANAEIVPAVSPHLLFRARAPPLT